MSKGKHKIVFILCLPFMAGLVYSVGRPVLSWLRIFLPNIPSVPFWFILALLMSSITLSYMLPYGKLSSALHLMGQTFPGNLLYRLLPMQSYGEKKYGSGTAIVTSGIGFYGIPVRFGVNNEVAVIDIE